MKTRGAIACLFVLTVFIALAWRVPDVIDRPLLSGTPGAPVGVPLPFAATDARESRRDIALGCGLHAFALWFLLEKYFWKGFDLLARG